MVLEAKQRAWVYHQARTSWCLLFSKNASCFLTVQVVSLPFDLIICFLLLYISAGVLSAFFLLSDLAVVGPLCLDDGWMDRACAPTIRCPNATF